MIYQNPVLQADFSDPDVIRVGDDFFMVASSFNRVPGVPVLHSKNLVEWRIANYVLDTLPFGRFDGVCHADGACAPSIRYRNGIFYCMLSFPDEGIFVCETDDPFGKWSRPRLVLAGKGYTDPCPVWADGRCYVAFAFDKSRIGFGSRLAVFETDVDLSLPAVDYTVVYDGRDLSPYIRCPKFYRRGNYFYILAPAGGSASGWQTVLRSEAVYGGYEAKIIMLQGDTAVNGPFSGALVDLDDGGEKWAFVHSQSRGAYGSAVHLQPAVWQGGWIICGASDTRGFPGTPVKCGEYPVDIKTDYKIDPSDEFGEETLSPVWHTPANRDKDWWSLKRGLRLKCFYYGGGALADVPQLVLQSIPHLNFSVKAKCRLRLACDGDETGLVVFGREYAYVCVVRQEGQNFLEIRKGAVGGGADETLCRSQPYDEPYVTFQLSARYEERNRLTFKFTFGRVAFTHKFYASAGVSGGARIGIYARSDRVGEGSADFKFFRVVCTDKRISPRTD